MTEMEKTILLELASLPEDQVADVLKYIRFLKFSQMDSAEIEKRFDQSWERARARAKELNITQNDIEEEIRAVREGR